MVRLEKEMGMKNSSKAIAIAALGMLAAALPAQASETLARKNACMSCHSIDKKIVGPAFKDISAKLSKEKDGEARAIKSMTQGSKGQWSPVPMPPMKNLKEEDAKLLAKWIVDGAKKDSK